MILFKREYKFPVDDLLPNSRLQAMKAILEKARESEKKPQPVRQEVQEEV